jgi:hypothetical protein
VATTGFGECLITDSIVRGATNAVSGGPRTRVDRCKVVPTSTAGPGTNSAGVSVTTFGTVAKTQMLSLASGATGITLGADSTAIENKLGGAYTTGILLSGTNAVALRNVMKTTTGSSSGIGISITGNNGQVTGNYIESTRAPGSASMSRRRGCGFREPGHQQRRQPAR